ncbi:5-oxoprolinase subunit B family protein [Kribbella sp. CA-293567]|uniref:5-oxoprolinase subunit B family protein n=1 Tax=Kribbella sp. CA-293567 TaxID=3002436 RepID=UPI0022DE5560|nr:allophanate hydrolase subunit 1 [Kribbella sp. CA-293567]WBQ06012.1 allophanate hydrolase subunit 1 [Kribbella sp. CA-293567]
MRILPAGDRAVLVELEDLDEVLGYYAALSDAPPAGVVDIIPAARTVMLTTDGADLAELTKALRSVRPITGTRTGGELVEIPVVYDGEDLPDLAELLNCSIDDVIERHTSEDWTVAFCGFAPGFGYLTGAGDWDVPRRESPRTKVPVGAVALAGEFSGVYPRESPGGWQLLGHTELKVFDQTRDPAALFWPGRRVRFVEVKT